MDQSNITQASIIAIVGMSGSGKSEVATFFKTKGYTVLRFGSVIDDGIKEEGLPWTPENNVYFRKKIRQELGMAALAIKMLPKIQEAINAQKKIVLDGLYSWEEYLYLREKIENLILLCVYARPSIRYARLEKRKERPFSNADARRRDLTEIVDTNKGGPIALADYLIKNETTLDSLHEQLNTFLSEVKT